MFDNSNPYTLRTASTDGRVIHYFISFLDEEGNRQETEVSKIVYNEVLRFIKKERNLRRWDERHLEYLELTDEEIYNRAFNPPKCLEDVFIDGIANASLHRAIRHLPKKQHRRFILYYEYGLTYKQIAEMEGCHFTSIEESIKCAIKNILKIIKNN